MARMKPLMTPDQQIAYRQAVAQKVIDSIPYEKYCAITPEQAAGQIKEWEKSKAVDFTQPLPNRRTAPAQEREAHSRAPEMPKMPEPEAPAGNGLRTRSQLNEFSRLVKDGRLTPISREKWAAISSKEMGKLIFVGQQREKRGEFAPARESREPEKEQGNSTPQKAGPAKAPRNQSPRPRSRGNDLDM